MMLSHLTTQWFAILALVLITISVLVALRLRLAPTPKADPPSATTSRIGNVVRKSLPPYLQ